jgi:nucleotide-binding universal stress UspA family protein
MQMPCRSRDAGKYRNRCDFDNDNRTSFANLQNGEKNSYRRRDFDMARFVRLVSPDRKPFASGGGGRMSKIKNILALTDLSKFSEEGVRYALNLARTLGAEVTVYHVNRDLAELRDETAGNGMIDITSPRYERLRKKAQLDLARFLNQHFSDLVPWVRIRERVEIGVPEKNIVEWVKREGADLVVISTDAPSDLSRRFFDSLAAKIVVNIPCPVLCLHPAEENGLQKIAAAG